VCSSPKIRRGVIFVRKKFFENKSFISRGLNRSGPESRGEVVSGRPAYEILNCNVLKLFSRPCKIARMSNKRFAARIFRPQVCCRCRSVNATELWIRIFFSDRATEPSTKLRLPAIPLQSPAEGLAATLVGINRVPRDNPATAMRYDGLQINFLRQASSEGSILRPG